MPDETENDRSWLLEPIGANEARIHVDVGAGAEVSSEVRAALDELVAAIHATEVEGFSLRESCPDLNSCSKYQCDWLGKCNPQSRHPCLWDVRCYINPLA